MSHTPTPWIAKQHSADTVEIRRESELGTSIIARVVPSGDIVSDATFIVRACNAHDELVAALETARLAIQTSEQSMHAKRQREIDALRAINAALAKVKPTKETA